MKQTCPKCGSGTKGNDGIAEWYHCGSLIYNTELGINQPNQSRACILRQIAALESQLAQTKEAPK